VVAVRTISPRVAYLAGRRRLAEELRVMARNMFPDDDTPRRLDAVLEETDRAGLDGAHDRLIALAEQWDAQRVPLWSTDAAQAVRVALRPAPAARHWRVAP
jgi:hypothetical protein